MSYIKTVCILTGNRILKSMKRSCSCLVDISVSFEKKFPRPACINNGDICMPLTQLNDPMGNYFSWLYSSASTSIIRLLSSIIVIVATV